jgi:hypothetical protein
MKEALLIFIVFVVTIFAWFLFYQLGYAAGEVKAFSRGVKAEQKLWLAEFGKASAHLEWIEDRLVNVHHDSMHADFIIKLRNIARRFKYMEEK